MGSFRRASAWIAPRRSPVRVRLAPLGEPLQPRGSLVLAFDQHIQLTAVGEVIFLASRHQTQRPDRRETGGLRFTTDFGLRARTPCRLGVTSTTEGREPNA